MIRRERAVVVSLLCGTAALVAACSDPLETRPCTPMTFTEVSVSGDTISTSTGLRYINANPGLGNLVADWCRTLAIHYDAYLADGTRFDSSREPERPLVFAPGFGALIDGIEQGVIGLRTGATRRLIIPPDLGFGSEPRRNAQGEIVVPANSTVIYDIEVLEIAP